MHIISSNFKWKLALVYMYDIMTSSKTPEQHIYHVHKALSFLYHYATTTTPTTDWCLAKCFAFLQRPAVLRHVLGVALQTVDSLNVTQHNL